jgi:hypothetical protein
MFSSTRIQRSPVQYAIFANHFILIGPRGKKLKSIESSLKSLLTFSTVSVLSRTHTPHFPISRLIFFLKSVQLRSHFKFITHSNMVILEILQFPTLCLPIFLPLLQTLPLSTPFSLESCLHSDDEDRRSPHN